MYVTNVIVLDTHKNISFKTPGADPGYCYSCLSSCQISRKIPFTSILGYFMSKMTSSVLKFDSGQLWDFFLDPLLQAKTFTVLKFLLTQIFNRVNFNFNLIWFSPGFSPDWFIFEVKSIVTMHNCDLRLKGFYLLWTVFYMQFFSCCLATQKLQNRRQKR